MSAPKVAVIYYSMYGHTLALAEQAMKAAKENGAEVSLHQVPETLPKEALEAMHAAPKKEDVPTIEPKDLANYDGFIFVIPTRYGRAVAQFSAFFDHTGGLWMSQGLSGKFATVITSTGTQNGGQETTSFTTLPFFVHHGIIHVPHGYTFSKTMSFDEIKGGSPWGAGTLAGPTGERQPSALELEETSHHAKHFVGVVSQFKRGASSDADKPSAAAATAETKSEEPAREPATTTPAPAPAKEAASTTTAPSTTAPSSSHQAGASSSSTAPTSASSENGNGKGGEKIKKRQSIFKKIKDAVTHHGDKDKSKK